MSSYTPNVNTRTNILVNAIFKTQHYTIFSPKWRYAKKTEQKETERDATHTAKKTNVMLCRYYAVQIHYKRLTNSLYGDMQKEEKRRYAYSSKNMRRRTTKIKKLFVWWYAKEKERDATHTAMKTCGGGRRMDLVTHRQDYTKLWCNRLQLSAIARTALFHFFLK